MCVAKADGNHIALRHLTKNWNVNFVDELQEKSEDKQDQ